MESAQGDLGDPIPSDVAQRLGLRFEDTWLLRRALTHRSYVNEHPEALEDNERLEFLGDAVLDFLVGAWLYNHFPEMSEGQLTRLRAALVGNDQLASFALQVNLGEYMLLGKGEEEGGGRMRSALLGCTFEALIGALFLDQNLEAVYEFIEPFLEEETQNILNGNGDQDVKSLLQEWSQSQGLGAPTYRTVSAFGPDHDKIFEVEVIIGGEVAGRGEGHSKQAAAKNAARAALSSIGSG
jgi:ribonuclease III